MSNAQSYELFSLKFRILSLYRKHIISRFDDYRGIFFIYDNLKRLLNIPNAIDFGGTVLEVTDILD